MSIYIGDIQPPKDGEVIIILPGGDAELFERSNVLLLGFCEKHKKTIFVPPHGDLVDAQEILRTFQVAAFSTYEDYEEAYDTVDFAETVIPADKEDT